MLGAVWLYRHRQEFRDPKLLAVPVGVWVAIAFAIVLAPWFVQRKADAAIAQADQALVGRARFDAGFNASLTRPL